MAVDAPSEPRQERSVSVGAVQAPLLRTAAFVSSDQGSLVATVELHGVLCALTSQQLRREMTQLIEEGVEDIVIDLQHLDLCTSHGVDVFEEADGALSERQRGSVQLSRARGITHRVLDIIDAADPTFGLVRSAEGVSPVGPG